MRSKSEELMLRIREYIESYFERYSSTPTVREIAGAMKIAVSSAHRYLVAMAEKDMVFYENGTLSTPKIRRMNPAVSPAAIVGSIPCGSPEEKEAQVEEYLPLSVSFFGKGGLLRPPGLRQLHGRCADRRRRPCYHPATAHRPGRRDRRCPHRRGQEHAEAALI